LLVREFLGELEGVDFGHQVDIGHEATQIGKWTISPYRFVSVMIEKRANLPAIELPTSTSPA
jgi:hypothetical protein